MNSKQTPIVYTAADIHRYLDGQMSPAEMYAIEKAALDDPLLADAIEGYEAAAQKDWTLDIDTLKQKLASVENTPVAPVYKSNFTRYWKAAAAVLLIATSVSVAWIFTRSTNNELPTVAAVETTPTAIEKPHADSTTAIADSTRPVIASNDHGSSGAFKVADSLTKANISLDSVTGNDFVYTPAPQQAAPVLEDAKATYQDNNSIEKKEAAPTTLDNNSLVAANASAPAETYRLRNHANTRVENNAGATLSDTRKDKSTYGFINAFNVQVSTPDNQPIAHAGLLLPHLKKSIYTDASGRAMITAADTTANIIVTAAGYNTFRGRLSSAAPQKIVLEPAEIAQQIKIGSKKAKAAVKPAAAEADEEEDDDIEPFGGWVEYNNYINNNRTLPNAVQQGNIHGEVEVKVTLKSNGEIARVKVEKPLCPECDAEAVRLITEGPKWDVKSKKAGEAKVKVKF